LLPAARFPPSGTGAPAGRQASGLPSGAQQVPFSVSGPRGTLHAAPAASDLQAANASGGGPRRGPSAPPSSFGSAAAVPAHRHKIARAVAADADCRAWRSAASFGMAKTPVESAQCRP
jgi:hypothetical protein